MGALHVKPFKCPLPKCKPPIWGCSMQTTSLWVGNASVAQLITPLDGLNTNPNPIYSTQFILFIHCTNINFNVHWSLLLSNSTSTMRDATSFYHNSLRVFTFYTRGAEFDSLSLIITRHWNAQEAWFTLYTRSWMQLKNSKRVVWCDKTSLPLKV